MVARGGVPNLSNLSTTQIDVISRDFQISELDPGVLDRIGKIALMGDHMKRVSKALHTKLEDYARCGLKVDHLRRAQPSIFYGEGIYGISMDNPDEFIGGLLGLCKQRYEIHTIVLRMTFLADGYLASVDTNFVNQRHMIADYIRLRFRALAELFGDAKVWILTQPERHHRSVAADAGAFDACNLLRPLVESGVLARTTALALMWGWQHTWPQKTLHSLLSACTWANLLNVRSLAIFGCSEKVEGGMSDGEGPPLGGDEMVVKITNELDEKNFIIRMPYRDEAPLAFTGTSFNLLGHVDELYISFDNCHGRTADEFSMHTKKEATTVITIITVIEAVLNEQPCVLMHNSMDGPQLDVHRNVDYDDDVVDEAIWENLPVFEPSTSLRKLHVRRLGLYGIVHEPPAGSHCERAIARLFTLCEPSLRALTCEHVLTWPFGRLADTANVTTAFASLSSLVLIECGPELSGLVRLLQTIQNSSLDEFVLSGFEPPDIGDMIWNEQNWNAQLDDVVSTLGGVSFLTIYEAAYEPQWQLPVAGMQTSLQALTFVENILSVRGLTSLAANGPWAQLESLNLMETVFNEPEFGDFVELLSLQCFPHLRKLVVEINHPPSYVAARLLYKTCEGRPVHNPPFLGDERINLRDLWICYYDIPSAIQPILADSYELFYEVMAPNLPTTLRLLDWPDEPPVFTPPLDAKARFVRLLKDQNFPVVFEYGG
jgi:hypothetical protein